MLSRWLLRRCIPCMQISYRSEESQSSGRFGMCCIRFRVSSSGQWLALSARIAVVVPHMVPSRFGALPPGVTLLLVSSASLVLGGDVVARALSRARTSAFHLNWCRCSTRHIRQVTAHFETEQGRRSKYHPCCRSAPTMLNSFRSQVVLIGAIIYRRLRLRVVTIPIETLISFKPTSVCHSTLPSTRPKICSDWINRIN